MACTLSPELSLDNFPIPPLFASRNSKGQWYATIRMTSPAPSQKSASGEGAPKGTPLSERTKSQINRLSLRAVQNDADEERADHNFTTPYPTKPAHVLLPSTIRLREQRLKQNDENDLHGTGIPDRFAKRLGSGNGPEDGSTSKAPAIRLKRSVKTLRDLYDAQAERSRPSTATSSVTSPVLRPSTAGSGLRSFSSREGLNGSQAWEQFHRAASRIKSADSDPVEALPTLDEVITTVRRGESESSRPDVEASSSSPNVQTFGNSSSSPTRSSRSMSSPVFTSVGRSSGSGATALDSSSPNFVRLAESSSPTTSSAVDSSSPNVIKLGTSSPTTKYAAYTQEEADSSPDTIRRDHNKRTQDVASFAARMKETDPFTSSPPDLPVSPTPSRAVKTDGGDLHYPDSSPPIPGSSVAPGVPLAYSEVTNTAYMPEDHFTTQSHANLQAAIQSSPASSIQYPAQSIIESSPAPSIQYPTVHVPSFANRSSINVAKRPPRSIANVPAGKWENRLSTVPSEWSGEKDVYESATRADHPFSQAKEVYEIEASLDGASVDEDTSDEDSFLEPPARAYLASSRDFSGSTIRMVSDADRHEATDRIADLRPSEWRSSPMQPRSSAFLSVLSSSNNMRNSVDNRLNSMRSFTSSRHNSIRSSLQRPGSSSSIVSNLPIPTWARRYYSGDMPKNVFYAHSQYSSTTQLTPRPSESILRPSTNHTSTNRTSTTRSSIPRTPLEHVASIFRPRNRPRMVSARQSHLEPGVGPLVSNPVDPLTAQNAQQRPVSLALNPADPRAHWASAEEAATETVKKEAELPRPPLTPYHPYRLFPRRRSWSPHLHQDYRAGGHPYRNLWHAPSVDEQRETLFNRRNAQVFSFILGFIFPISWFVAAFLPLPPKPRLQMDEISRIPTPNIEAQIIQQMDIADDIRYENARWWRNLNRVMCPLGTAVLVIVITLATIYR